MFHRHSWKVISWQPVATYGDGWGNTTKLPTAYKTHVALQCETCGDVKSKALNGSFTRLPKGIDHD